MKRSINGVKRTKSRNLLMEINPIDEDEMCLEAYFDFICTDKHWVLV
jgi:hypothetical protein